MSNPSSPDLWRKVLVPTDFSDCSLPALRAAALMRRGTDMEIILLHVTEPGYEGLRVQTGELHEQMKNAALAELKKTATMRFPDVSNVRILVREGRPADVICQTALSEKADVVIISSHGHSGLKHVLLGSVAEKVARHASCSVFVVRD